MQRFSIELLHPKASTLNAIILKNDFLKIPETLLYSIQINLEEFILSASPINTSIILSRILLNIVSLKELENKEYNFPINPVDGYVDGSIYLFEAHNPFDVKKIKFSKIKNGMIDATLYYDIDFEYENTGYAKMQDGKLQVFLSLGELSIDTDIMNAENFNTADAKKLLSKFCIIDEYEEPTIRENKIIFKMKK